MIQKGFLFIVEDEKITSGQSELPKIVEWCDTEMAFSVVSACLNAQDGLIVLDEDSDQGLIWAISEDDDISISFAVSESDFIYLSDFVRYVADFDLYIDDENVNMNLYKCEPTGLVQVDFLYGGSDYRGQECIDIVAEHSGVDVEFKWELFAEVVPFVKEI